MCVFAYFAASDEPEIAEVVTPGTDYKDEIPTHSGVSARGSMIWQRTTTPSTRGCQRPSPPYAPCLRFPEVVEVRETGRTEGQAFASLSDPRAFLRQYRLTVWPESGVWRAKRWAVEYLKNLTAEDV